MIRIWYLVRENDDDAEEDDCGDACLVLANRTCPRTGLHFTFSSRLHTGPSLNITYHWLRKTVWLVGNDQLFYWDSCLKNSLLHCLRKMQNATKGICENSSRDSLEPNRLRNWGSNGLLSLLNSVDMHNACTLSKSMRDSRMVPMEHCHRTNLPCC